MPRKKVEYSGLGKEEFEELVKEIDSFFGDQKMKKPKLVSIGFTSKEAHDVVSDIAKLKRQEVVIRSGTLNKFRPLVSDETWARAVVSTMKDNEGAHYSDEAMQIEWEAMEIIFRKQKAEIRKKRKASALYYLEKANRIAMGL